MKWKILIPFLTVPFFISCRSSNEQSLNEYIIRGQFANADGIVIHLEELTTGELLKLDSVVAGSNGTFSFRRIIDDVGFYNIRIGQNDHITLLLEPGEEVSVTGDAQHLVNTYEVKGSEGSALLAYLNKNLWINRQKVDSLVRDYREKKQSQDAQDLRKELEQSFRAIFVEQQNFVKDFISDHPNSLASVIALYQYFGRHLLLTEHEHFDYFELLSNALSEKYPNNKHVLDLKRRVSEHSRNELKKQLDEERISVGSQAPDIILPDPGGKQIALSSLKGNVVLVDFWAAWCPPCRKSNEQLKEIYQEYHPKGFEIYAVSLDRTLEQWTRGIEEDQTNWIQVSDLRFWNSPVVSLYNVRSIPHTVLIDTNGKIIGKGLNPDEIRSMLSGILD